MVTIAERVLEFYKAKRAAGFSPRRAHTAAEKFATKLLGTVRGAWDLATQAQEAVDGR